MAVFHSTTPLRPGFHAGFSLKAVRAKKLRTDSWSPKNKSGEVAKAKNAKPTHLSSFASLVYLKCDGIENEGHRVFRLAVLWRSYIQQQNFEKVLTSPAGVL